MKRFALNVMLAVSVLASPLLTGCDKTVSEEQKVVKKSDGTTVTDKDKTTQSPDGATNTTSEHKVDKVSP